MAGLVHRLVRKGKRRIKDWRRHHRTEALIEAGVRLLALRDYDHISVAKITKEAGCSVGAFYARFPKKDAFLYHLIASTFRNLTEDAERVLAPVQGPKESGDQITRKIVGYIVGRLADRRTAGVIRATMKLAPQRPTVLELFQDYRTSVTDRAITLLSPKLDGQTRPIRIAMQIVFATVTDAILQGKAGPMPLGSSRMTETLSDIMTGYLGLADGYASADPRKLTKTAAKNL